jgi:hypothetical protein
MKSEKDKNRIIEPFTGDRFNFNCHKEIACFTLCCSKLNMTLTPYDIVRLKRRLGLRSQVFLEKYTEVVMERDIRFPMIKLRMLEAPEKKCPFVSDNGCTVYEDRPSACRLYPIGRAATSVEGYMNPKEKFFMVKESHCHGFRESVEWSLNEWIKSQGLDEYIKMNDKWLEIITSQKHLGPREEAEKKFQAFYLASYNIDKFRELIFSGRFFKLFQVEDSIKEKIKKDDVALLEFAFRWLKFSLFGEKTIRIMVS